MLGAREAGGRSLLDQGKRLFLLFFSYHLLRVRGTLSLQNPLLARMLCWQLLGDKHLQPSAGGKN